MVERKFVKVQDVVKIGITLVRTIERLHSLGIVHNDVKPDNIMIYKSKQSGFIQGGNPRNSQTSEFLPSKYEVALIDFGQSKHFQDH